MALRLGFQTVEQWRLATSRDEQAKQLAVAYLDGWGEEWQEICATVHNAALLIATAQGVRLNDDQWKTCRGMERMPKEMPRTATDWAALESAWKGAVLGHAGD